MWSTFFMRDEKRHGDGMWGNMREQQQGDATYGWVKQRVIVPAGQLPASPDTIMVGSSLCSCCSQTPRLTQGIFGSCHPPRMEVSSGMIVALANNVQHIGAHPATRQTLFHHGIAMRTMLHKRISSVNRADGRCDRSRSVWCGWIQAEEPPVVWMEAQSSADVGISAGHTIAPVVENVAPRAEFLAWFKTMLARGAYGITSISSSPCSVAPLTIIPEIHRSIGAPLAWNGSASVRCMNLSCDIFSLRCC